MTLARADVQTAIRIVSSDAAARSRIDSVLAPALGAASRCARSEERGRSVRSLQAVSLAGATAVTSAP
jgi:hypothetical protein